MDVRIEPSWKQQLQEEFDKPYFEKLVTFVKDEYKRARSEEHTSELQSHA